MAGRLALGVLVPTLVLAAAACSSPKKSNDRQAPSDAMQQLQSDAGLPVIAFTPARGGTPIRLAVEVADTEELRTCGLMHRPALHPEQGMLFVFTTDVAGGFWMRNTLIRLSIAFIAVDGRIVDILDMEPAPPGGPYPTYTPRGAYRYAVEANHGWFARHGLAPGDRVDVVAAVQQGSKGQPPPLCREKGI